MDETDQAYEYIHEIIVPKVIELFKLKTQDHSGAPHFLMLGSKGQFAEINKKYWKLYNAIWQERQLVGEQPIEVTMDLIGHSLLLLYCLEQEMRRDPMYVEFEPGD